MQSSLWIDIAIIGIVTLVAATGIGSTMWFRRRPVHKKPLRWKKTR